MDTRMATAHDLARRSLRLMERWDDDEAAAIIHPDATNDEAVSEPPAARGRGPAAFKATYDWLHAAFEDLRWEVRELVAEDDLVVVRTVMCGRQVAPFATYGPDGRVAQVLASRAVLRRLPDPLVPPGRRPHRLARGRPRRSRPGPAARLGPAQPGLPGPLGPGQAAPASRRRLSAPPA